MRYIRSANPQLAERWMKVILKYIYRKTDLKLGG